jgi:predicted metal-dependent hydrolase
MKKYWVNNSAVWTHFADSISILFPAWERAFVAVAQHHLPSVKDPLLALRIKQFMKEEVSHANAHEAYNNRNDLKKAELEEFRKTKIIYRKPGLKIWLGTMVSIEHFAACLARGVLEKFDGRSDRDSQLFLWHSKEELGHKSLAIDLWRYLGYSDSELRKIAKTNQAYVIKFLVGHTLKNLWKDNSLKQPKVWKDLAIWGWFMVVKVLIPAIEIYMPNFHPDKHDDSKWISA